MIYRRMCVAVVVVAFGWMYANAQVPVAGPQPNPGNEQGQETTTTAKILKLSEIAQKAIDSLAEAAHTRQVIDHRDFAIERIRDRGGRVREIDYSRDFDGTPKEMPWQFSRAGARPVMRIFLPNDRFTAADLQYAEELFPEAEVALTAGVNAKLRNQGYVLKSPPATSNGTVISLREDTEGFYKSWNSGRKNRVPN